MTSLIIINILNNPLSQGNWKNEWSGSININNIYMMDNLYVPLLTYRSCRPMAIRKILPSPSTSIRPKIKKTDINPSTSFISSAFQTSIAPISINSVSKLPRQTACSTPANHPRSLMSRPNKRSLRSKPSSMARSSDLSIALISIANVWENEELIGGGFW